MVIFVMNNQFYGYTHCFGDIMDIYGVMPINFFSDFFSFFFKKVSYLLGLLIHYSLTTDVNIFGKK